MGFVPNSKMKTTFMAVAIDTYDKDGGIHSRFGKIPTYLLITTYLLNKKFVEVFPPSF